jgi:predicted regulator of Ras-like GTPase activity (Roadblock/LC7/MglB family)
MLDIWPECEMDSVFTRSAGIITASRIFRPFPGCMFRFLRNLLSKKSTAPIAVPVARVAAVPARAVAPGVAPARTVEAAAGAAGGAGMQRVETAQLQLLAIMSKFPDDLRKLVQKMPPENAMVVMPIPAILRFLPTGSVKMSLASIVRQAPSGTFASINPQDKRLVEVPLAEIFKRVSPAILKRRDDQRYSDLAVDGFDIFGDDENPYNLAPRVENEPEPQQPPEPTPPPVIPQPRVLQMAPGMVAAPPPGAPPTKRHVSPPTQPLAAKPRVAVPPTPFVPPPTAVPPPHTVASAEPPIDDGQPPLVLPLKDLHAGWPEPIRSEASVLNGTTVSLPAGQVGVGLARGKVAFNWGQIRAWMNPPPPTPTEASDSIELLLPLRVIAPAFLKHSKGAAPRKSASIGEEIPELFGGRGLAAPPPVAVPPPAPAPAPAPAPPPPAQQPPVAPPAQPARPVSPTPVAPPVFAKRGPAATAVPANEIPESLFAPVRGRSVPPPAPVPEPVAPAPSIAEEPPPAPVPVQAAPFVEVRARTAEPPLAPAARPVAAVATAEPQSLAEAFNQPGKVTWSPTEIINALAELPEIAGSVVALQEGLVVAHRLPDPLKGEVFSAFLPQIFARINQYSNEMKLGAVNDLLVNAHGLPCHLFRVGQVYFAALGKPGIPLPTPILRLCAAALAS